MTLRSKAGTLIALAAVVAVAALVAVLVWALGDGSSGGERTAAGSMADVPRAPVSAVRELPNIVVISTDDQTLASFTKRVMPRTIELLAEQGTTFTDSIVTTPVCCPARATYVTGQYAHNHGVMNNKPGYSALREKDNILPAWMQRAGYRTAHVGKYLNRYSEAVEHPERAPAGWDDWRTEVSPHNYYDYPLGVNGEVVSYGDEDDDYLTRVLTGEALDIIETAASRPRPLFLTLDHFTPHNGGGRGDPRCRKSAPVPDPDDVELFEDEPLPTPPSFDEADVSDKPSFIRRLPRVSSGDRRELTEHYRCTLAALRGVDRSVEAVYDALEEAGELENTVIVFWSDNGYFNGEHRLVNKKQLNYEEGVRVPIVVRVGSRVKGGAESRSVVGAPVANIDLAPTILDFAGGDSCLGADRCRTMDGRSLRGLIRGRPGDFPRNRPLLIEYRRGPKSNFTCEYRGVRARGRVYVEHVSVPDPETGVCESRTEIEHYDLREDRFQLRNLHPTEPGSDDRRAEAALTSQLRRLERCSGVAGRDPRPNGEGTHCQ